MSHKRDDLVICAAGESADGSAAAGQMAENPHTSVLLHPAQSTPTLYRLYLCTGLHCAARAAGIREALENALWETGLLGAVELHPGGCQAYCDYGPNLLIQPGNRRYAGVTPERATTIVREDLTGLENL